MILFLLSLLSCHIQSGGLPSEPLTLENKLMLYKCLQDSVRSNQELTDIFPYKNFIFYKHSQKASDGSLRYYLCATDIKKNSNKSLHYFSQNFKIKILEKAGITEFLPNGGIAILLCMDEDKTYVFGTLSNEKSYTSNLFEFLINESAVGRIFPFTTEKEFDKEKIEENLKTKNIAIKDLSKVDKPRIFNSVLKSLKTNINAEAKFGFDMHCPKTLKDHFKKTEQFSLKQTQLSFINFKKQMQINIQADTWDID